MKRIVCSVSLVILVLALAAWAQAPAPKPGPEHQKVKMYVGHWTYTGEYKPGPIGPGGAFTGEYNAQMILGGFFLQGHWTEKNPSGEVKGFETFGYDPANKNYFQSQYQDDGSMASGVLTVSGNTWTYSGKTVAAGKQYAFRATLVFAADLAGIELKADISTDGSTWTPFIEAKFTKAKPAPKKK